MSEGTVLTERHAVKARKRHHCDWCGKRIDVGELHDVSSIVGDGSVYTWRECSRCAEYVPKARESFDLPSWEPMYREAFEDYMAAEHPIIWWQWCVDDDLEWLEYAERHRYEDEAERDADKRRFSVALELARERLDQAKAREAR